MWGGGAPTRVCPYVCIRARVCDVDEYVGVACADICDIGTRQFWAYHRYQSRVTWLPSITEAYKLKTAVDDYLLQSTTIYGNSSYESRQLSTYLLFFSCVRCLLWCGSRSKNTVTSVPFLVLKTSSYIQIQTSTQHSTHSSSSCTPHTPYVCIFYGLRWL